MEHSGDQVRPNLTQISETSVKTAIGRGRKRRAGQRGVPSTSVDLQNSQTPARSNVPYYKRRKTSLIPHPEPDPDSNDEWEEHVELDEQAVHAAIERSQKLRPSSPPVPDSKPTPVPARKVELTEAQKKAFQRRKNAHERKIALRQHSLSILLLVAQLLRQDVAADSELVRAFAISILPDDSLLGSSSDVERLSRIALWARATFKPYVFVASLTDEKKTQSFKRLCNVEERVFEICGGQTGDIMDVVTVLAACVRGLGFRCRVVSALQPGSWQVFRNPNRVLKASHRMQVVNSRKEWEISGVLYAWLEVWSPDTRLWLPVDVVAGVVCKEGAAEIVLDSIANITEFNAKKGSGKQRRNVGRRARRVHPSMMSHVVAVESGIVTDVTRRYVQDWGIVDKVRAKGRIFETVLENLGKKDAGRLDDEVRISEIEEFDALAAGEEMPKTVSAVHNHPRYVLERHLKKYEVIYPMEPVVGHIKQEPIYLRSHVHLLHTRDRWIRQMREVAEGAKSLKCVKSKNGTDESVELFGEWQTHPLLIPECVDGIVPRSVHGNVDLWTADHLPKGTVHINMPFARHAARKLGVDFAPAMTGFEIRGRRSVPKIEGVVVAVENGSAVGEEALKGAEAAAERAEKKAREEACDRWRKLLRTMSAREKIRKRYGGALNDAGTYEAVQKRESSRKGLDEKEGRQKAERAVLSERVERLKGSEGHTHEFGPSRCLQGDTWTKKCLGCGLDVTFETL